MLFFFLLNFVCAAVKLVLQKHVENYYLNNYLWKYYFKQVYIFLCGSIKYLVLVLDRQCSFYSVKKGC